MRYSGKSFDPSRLPACYGAIQAVHPKAVLEVQWNGITKTGDEALELLRSKWKPDSTVRMFFQDSNGAITIVLREMWDLFYVNIEGENEEACQRVCDLVRGSLGLAEASEKEIQSESNLYSINQRILRLHGMIEELPAKLQAATRSGRLQCFVSFRFDEHSKALALELRDFLDLAGIEFVSGLGYEPRSISEKVLDRLKGKIDLFIAIFAAGGDSAWLHQEIGVAKGHNLPVMVLREEGINFDEGLLADTEYASFPKGHISGAFIPVLQAIRYIRLKPGTE